MDVDKIYLMLSTAWRADLSNEEGIRVSDMSLDLLQKLLDTVDYHENPVKFFSIFDKASEIASHVDPHGALPLLMQYAQRHEQLDARTLCSCTRWLDHITGFNGTKYADGSRILLNLLKHNLDKSDESEIRLATNVYTLRTLLRWKHPNKDILVMLSNHSEKADMLYNALGATPPIPRRYLEDSFYEEAIRLIEAIDSEKSLEISEMYQGKRSFVL